MVDTAGNEKIDHRRRFAHQIAMAGAGVYVGSCAVGLALALVRRSGIIGSALWLATSCVWIYGVFAVEQYARLWIESKQAERDVNLKMLEAVNEQMTTFSRVVVSLDDDGSVRH